MPIGRDRLPAWLQPEVARGIAEAARAALGARDTQEVARAAVRAVAVACLPSLPAPMLAELLDAVVPADPASPEHGLPALTRTDPTKLAQRLDGLLVAGGANQRPTAGAERIAARLAGAGAARIGAD